MKHLMELRKTSGLSQNKLGEIVHLSDSAIAGYETGRRYPDVQTLMLLADYFDVSVDYLLDRTDNPSMVESSEETLGFLKLIYKIPLQERDMYKLILQNAVELNELKLERKKYRKDL